MRFHRLPESLFGSPARLAVLRQMLRAPGREFAGSQLAREADVSIPWTLKILNEFAAAGLLAHRRVPPVDLWRLNTDHVLVPAVRDVLRLDQSLADRLRRDVRSALRGIPVERAVLFGSVARGTERPTSDIDVLLVVPDTSAKRKAQERISKAHVRILSRYGNSLSAIVYTAPEFKRKRGLPLIRNIERQGIVLWEGRN